MFYGKLHNYTVIIENNYFNIIRHTYILDLFPVYCINVR